MPQRKSSGIGTYFIFLMILFLILFGISRIADKAQDYSRERLISDLESGKVTQAVITPNSETPTGSVMVSLKDGTVRKLYVTNIQEAEALIKEMLTLDNPYHCPHGRPTMIRLTKREVEKRFGRIV